MENQVSEPTTVYTPEEIKAAWLKYREVREELDKMQRQYARRSNLKKKELWKAYYFQTKTEARIAHESVIEDLQGQCDYAMCKLDRLMDVQ